VEPNRRFDTRERFLVAVTFSDHNSLLEAERVGDIAIGMLLHNNLELPSHPALTLVSEQEYLGSQYEPDCEFEDGVLIERHVGTEKHSWMQAALAAYVFHRRKAWGVNVYTEQRARVRPGKYKLPDVCIVQGPRPTTPVFEQPPLVAIEILSPEDEPLRVDQTIAEWLEFGVGHVWVVDPEKLDATLRIPGTPIEIPLRQLEEE
jgi:Uma2 family endonuclease